MDGPMGRADVVDNVTCCRVGAWARPSPRWPVWLDEKTSSSGRFWDQSAWPRLHVLAHSQTRGLIQGNAGIEKEPRSTGGRWREEVGAQVQANIQKVAATSQAPWLTSLSREEISNVTSPESVDRMPKAPGSGTGSVGPQAWPRRGSHSCPQGTGSRCQHAGLLHQRASYKLHQHRCLGRPLVTRDGN